MLNKIITFQNWRQRGRDRGEELEGTRTDREEKTGRRDRREETEGKRKKVRDRGAGAEGKTQRGDM
jgi:hypothetical protein